MAISDVYRGVTEILAIAWVYRLCLNPYWLRTVGAFAESKYCLQGCAVFATGTHIWHGNLSAAHRRGSDVVEDAGDDVDLVRIDTIECETRV